MSTLQIGQLGLHLHLFTRRVHEVLPGFAARQVLPVPRGEHSVRQFGRGLQRQAAALRGDQRGVVRRNLLGQAALLGIDIGQGCGVALHSFLNRTQAGQASTQAAVDLDKCAAVLRTTAVVEVAVLVL